MEIVSPESAREERAAHTAFFTDALGFRVPAETDDGISFLSGSFATLRLHAARRYGGDGSPGSAVEPAAHQATSPRSLFAVSNIATAARQAARHGTRVSASEPGALTAWRVVLAFPLPRPPIARSLAAGGANAPLRRRGV